MKLLQLLACLLAAALCQKGVWKRWKEGGKVYFFEYDHKDQFIPAREYCQERDSELVVINTAKENAWIWMNRRPGKHYWIGFVFDDEQRGYQKNQWIDGSSYGYNNWHKYPSSYRLQGRIGVMLHNRYGQWDSDFDDVYVRKQKLSFYMHHLVMSLSCSPSYPATPYNPQGRIQRSVMGG